MPLPEMVALELAAHLHVFPSVKVTLPWREPEARPETVGLVVTTRERTALARTYFNRHLLEAGARRRRRAVNSSQWHARATSHLRERAPGGRRVDQSACRVSRARRSGLHPSDLHPPDAVQSGPRPGGGRSGLRHWKTARRRSDYPPERTVKRELGIRCFRDGFATPGSFLGGGSSRGSLPEPQRTWRLQRESPVNRLTPVVMVILATLTAALLGLATNIATSSDRLYPFPLRWIETYPWHAVLGLSAIAVLYAAFLSKRSWPIDQQGYAGRVKSHGSTWTDFNGSR